MRHAAALALLVVLAGCSRDASSASVQEAKGAETPAAKAAPVQDAPVTVEAPPAASNALVAVAAPPATSNAPAPEPAKSPYEAVLIKDVPHVRQKTDFCGEACAEMFLKHLGKKWDQDDVFNASGVDPILGRGCYTRELSATLTRIGMNVGNVSYRISAAHAAAELEKQWKALYSDLLRGVGSIVCMHYSGDAKTTEHFRLVLGYDPAKDDILYHEPAEADGGYRRMNREEFLDLWPLKYDANTWTVIRMRLEPGRLQEPSLRPAGFTPADYAQHVMATKKQVPKGFSMVLAAPFVVIGNEPPALVKQRAESTVKWAVTHLKADYFAKDPDAILDIWLFKDPASYQKGAKEIFGDTPTTPYGYYSSEHKALIMDISTGGGTLVHEIVHPFMRTNFPDCPDWLNEGMGSLYEQSQEKGGHINGATNWRLAGLQRAIAGKGLPTFKALCSTTNSEFYNKDDKGTNYAQARYLCYYLQEKGLLVKFYHEFVANSKADPTGYKTLQQVLGETDMAAFQKRWEAYVMKLTFP